MRDGRRMPFFQVIKDDVRAMEDACADPSVSVKLSAVRSTYFALLEFANDDRADETNVTRKALADRAGVSTRTCQEATAVLEGAGLLVVTELRGAGSTGNSWTLLDAPNRQPPPVQTGSQRRDNRQPPPVPMETVQEGEETPLPPEGDPVEKVWGCYVATMDPRRVELPVDERRLIRDALTVATADECCQAIRGCSLSPFHMGQNDRGKKYNRLTQILKAKRGVRTLREQIDMFLEIAESRGGGGHSSSAERARIAEAKRNVLDAHSLSGSEHAKKRGEMAALWLAEHGWRVVTGPDGRPTFEASS